MQKRRTRKHAGSLLSAGIVSILIAGCGGGGGGSQVSQMPAPTPAPPPPQEMVPPPLDPTGQNLGAFFAVTDSNRFVSFNPAASALSTNVAITGLNGQRAVGLDVRTADGTVLLVTDFGIVYELNPRTGTTRSLGGGVSPGNNQFGVEFVGAPEQVRMVSSAGRNLAVSGFGELSFDLQSRGPTTSELVAVQSGIAEIAATQSGLPCGDTPVLYYLDTTRDTLFVERQTDEGLVLITVGPLGVNADTAAGFEIFQQGDASDVAVATLRVNGVLGLYGIDLTTGRATLQSPVPPGLRSSETLVGLARLPLPNPPRRTGRMAALTQSGKLMAFDERAPAAVCTPSQTITGLQPTERLLDIDVRASDGLLYGLSSAARIYTIDTTPASFGAATLRSTLKAQPGDPFTGLMQPTASIDFDPGNDLLMVVNENPDTEIAVDVDSGLVSSVNRLFSRAGDTPTFIAVSGSFAPSPDPTRRRIEFQRRTFDSDFGPIMGFDYRGADGSQFVARRADKLAGTVLESRADSTLGLDSRRLIGGGEAVGGIAYLPTARATVFALTIDNQLLSFKPTTPSNPDTVVRISGLQPAEQLLAIDTRITDDVLFGLSDAGRIYTINPVSGAATLRSTLSMDAGSFAGLEADIAFGPVTGSLRISASGGRNLRVNVDTGAVLTDATYSRRQSTQPPAFTGVGYLPPNGSGPSGVFVLLDAANGQLARVVDPSIAVDAVRAVSRVGQRTGILPGFDVTADREGLFFANTAQGSPMLLKENLLFGGTSWVGTLALPNANDQVTGLAADPKGLPAREDRPLIAVLNQTSLISFTQKTLQAPSAPLPVTGLVSGETLLCIDFNGSGVLFGLGSSGRVYSINTVTGMASAAAFLTGASLRGTRFDMDIDPLSGQLTVVSDAQQVVTMDVLGNSTQRLLNYLEGAVTANAYTNSIPGSAITDHYFIDTASASLQTTVLEVGPVNSGEADESRQSDLVTLSPINRLESSEGFTKTAAFDIAAGDDAVSLAALQPTQNTQSILYTIDLDTRFASLQGAGRRIGAIGPPGTAPIRGLAIRIR